MIWNFEIDKNNNLILFLGDDENIRKLKYYDLDGKFKYDLLIKNFLKDQIEENESDESFLNEKDSTWPYTFAFYLNNQLCHFNRDSSTFNRVILNDLISIKT